MKKHRCLLFTVFVVVLVSFVTRLQAAEQFSEFIRLGHADEQLDGYDGSVNSGQDHELKRAVAIYIPAARMIPCKNNYISVVKFALAQSIYFSEKGLKIFVTKDLNAPYDYEQEVTDIVSMWNQVALDTPFPIDGSGVYIGYEYYASNKSGISRLTPNTDISSDWCFRNGEWVKAGNPSALAIQGVVEGDHLPKYNVELNKTELVTFVELGQKMTVSGEFTNIGTATLHRFDVNYRLNGGEWVSQTFGNVEIPYESSYKFRADHLTFPATGEYTVEIAIGNPGGHDDVDPADNVSPAYTVGCVDAFTPRNLLMELFTTENCPNCPEGIEHLESVIRDHPDVYVVEHHSGYGTDDFTVPASVDYEWFYNGAVFAPSLMMDRRNQHPYKTTMPDNSPVFGVGALTSALLDNSLKIPAFATVGLQVNYHKDTREATIHVAGKRLLPLSGNDSRLFVYLTENNVLTKRQAGMGGSDFYHQHMLREVLTGVWGDPVDLNEGYSADYTATIAEDLNAEEMRVVAFVANYNPEDVNNCTVYNTAQARIVFDAAVSGENLSPVSVIVSGKTIRIAGEYDAFKLFDLSGRCVMQRSVPMEEIPVEGLPGGVYLMRMQTQEGNRVCKVVLSE